MLEADLNKKRVQLGSPQKEGHASIEGGKQGAIVGSLVNHFDNRQGDGVIPASPPVKRDQKRLKKDGGGEDGNGTSVSGSVGSREEYRRHQ
jgi:hypothetical protein